MGVRILVGGYSFEATDYSVDEAATPLAAGDSSGGVGTISLTIPRPDPDATVGAPVADKYAFGLGPFGEEPFGGYGRPGWYWVNKFGPDILLDKEITLTDSRRGYTLGFVNSVSRSDDSGTLSISGQSRLSLLNVYGIQAQPFAGTLEQAFEYYLSLANVDTGLLVDDEIADRQVVFPGWNGELWYYLKQMAVAQDCDISLVSGVILLRPIRARVASRGRDIGRTRDLPAANLAQAVEVYLYNNRVITNELVYPPGGWNEEVEVLNVNAGETAEYTLELSASVSSIQTPTFQTFVGPTDDSASVYTVIANDGLPISQAAWEQNGGSLKVEINPDTTTLKVTLRGATKLPTATGEWATNFSIALASDFSGNRYSTLRIVGSGVAFDKVKKRIRTGVPASRTATEIGVTIDNPFISTVDDLYRAGTRAAKAYAGPTPALSGNILSINRLGDSGSAVYPTYGDVEAHLTAEIGGTPTYEDVEDYYTVTQALTTYRDVQDYWFDLVRDDFANQVFGNVNGARIYDKQSRRWYRIRSGTINAATITFDAEDDLTYGDIEDLYAGQTYGDINDLMAADNLTYRQVDLAGLYNG